MESDSTKFDSITVRLMMERRSPAKWRVIKDISPDDIKVRVIGRIVESRPGFVVLDDGSGSIIVRTDEELEIGNIIRAIGNIHRKKDGDLEIVASIIQNMNDLDFSGYMEVYELRKKYIENGLK